MDCFVRKLEKILHWEERDWLPKKDVQSDTLGYCLRTQQNALSIYNVGNEQQINRVVAALALNRSRLNHIDLAVVPIEVLSVVDVVTNNDVLGKTPDSGVNQWHSNLLQLSVTKLACLAKAILDRGSIYRLQERVVCEAIELSLKNNWVILEKVEETLIESLSNRGMAKYF